ncbi:uncharacterized protein [Lolium perenne]|uniref:uncharacterized protein n=1 Tax=Lolium perenne TaxID=4522 RepID=UPI003A99872A
MERGKGKEGKGKEAAVDDTQLAAPSAAGAAPDLSSGWGQTARYGWPVAAPASKKRAHETEAQMRRRKKKNQKTRERQERKAAGLKINSPDDVPTFEEFDSADPSEEDPSDEVCSDREDRDVKSRHVLRRLRSGEIRYLLGPGRFKCPWCSRKEMPTDFLGMYQHATYTGVGSGQTPAHIRAKHAAYGLFLKKYAPRQ